MPSIIPPRGSEDPAITHIIIDRIIQKKEIRTKAAILCALFYPGRKDIHEDILQNFIEKKLCRLSPAKIKAFEKGETALFSAAFTNFLRTRKRSDKRRTRTEEIGGAIQIPTSGNYNPEQVAKVIRAIRNAFGEKKAIIISMTISGYASAEIGKRIGTSANAVNTQRSKLRKDKAFIQIINQII